MFKFEARIINPILRVIKNNQEYLTLHENLPQLAKLGYMYNTLWYGGRMASYNGIIEKNQCLDNPKYKIEACDSKNNVIRDYIYDAWGIHVSNDYGPGWEEFRQIILEGRPLTALETKLIKPNKTFDEWVEILTDPRYDYAYFYPNSKEVADHLLCVIGNGYGYKNGYVFQKAGGADQDIADYGDWMNAKFSHKIQKIVDKIINDPDVEKVLKFIDDQKIKQNANKKYKDFDNFGMSNEEFLELFGVSPEDFLKKAETEAKLKAKEYQPYYPICNYSIITKLDKNSHPSYINAAIKICEDILAHRKEENSKSNIKFATKFIEDFKKQS